MVGELKEEIAENFELQFSENHGSLNHSCHAALVEYNLLVGLVTLEPGQKDEKAATRSRAVTETAVCNFATGNPWIIIMKVNVS